MENKTLIIALIGTALILFLAIGSYFYITAFVPQKVRLQVIMHQYNERTTRLKAYITYAVEGDIILPFDNLRLKRIISKDSVMLELGEVTYINSTDWTGNIFLRDSAVISYDLVRIGYNRSEDWIYPGNWIRIDTCFNEALEFDSTTGGADVTDQLTDKMLEYTAYEFYGDGRIRTESKIRLHDYEFQYRYGLSRTWAPNGQIIEKMSYKFNCPVGPYSRWYTNGQKKEEGFAIDCPDTSLLHKRWPMPPLLNGNWVFWDSTGIQTGKGEFNNGTGKKEIRYPDGKPKRFESYKDGNPGGVWYEWYEDGQVKEKIDYTGESGAHWYCYLPDGFVYHDTREFRRHKPSYAYHGNGKFMAYEYSARTYHEWYSDGNLKYEVVFEKLEDLKGNVGKYMHGDFHEWYADGTIKWQGRFERNQPVDIWSRYDANGVPERTIHMIPEGKGPPSDIRSWYYPDSLLFYMEENTSDNDPLPAGQGIMSFYNPDGGIESQGECLFKPDIRHNQKGGDYPDDIVPKRTGVWRYYDSDGNITKLDNWDTGHRTDNDGRPLSKETIESFYVASAPE